MHVYSSPEVKESKGCFTLALGHVALAVEWNGHTAEAKGYATITNDPKQGNGSINYGLSVNYQVDRVDRNGNQLEAIALFAPLPLVGIINKKDDPENQTQSDTLYKSTSIKGVHKWDTPGTRFHVYARVKAEAWRDIEFKDTWLLEKTVPLIIPRPEND